MENITLDTTNGNLIVNRKPIVHYNTNLEIAGYKNELPITITADFTDIPKDQHQIFLDTFTLMYNIER
jgi:hypothetical protein